MTVLILHDRHARHSSSHNTQLLFLADESYALHTAQLLLLYTGFLTILGDCFWTTASFKLFIIFNLIFAVNFQHLLSSFQTRNSIALDVKIFAGHCSLGASGPHGPHTNTKKAGAVEGRLLS